MDPSTPSASPWVFLVLCALLALHVIARYKLGFLPEKEWQVVHVALGWAIVALVLVAAHGADIIRRVAWRTWALLVIGIGFLMLFWYVGRSDGYRDLFGSHDYETETLSPLLPFAYFALGAVGYRLVLPFVVARLAFRRSARSLGLPLGRPAAPRHAPGEVRAPPTSTVERGDGVDRSLRGIGWIYLGLYLGILPLLFLASLWSDYLAKYPLARDIISPDLGIWIVHFLVYEALYALVFVSGEAFWRGYLTFGAERDLGLYAISFMLVPYVTGHFGKPFSETLGAIVAGSLLGFLALRHRSVWLGAALHYGVALSMDLLAVWRNGIVIHD